MPAVRASAVRHRAACAASTQVEPFLRERCRQPQTPSPNGQARADRSALPSQSWASLNSAAEHQLAPPAPSRPVQRSLRSDACRSAGSTPPAPPPGPRPEQTPATRPAGRTQRATGWKVAYATRPFNLKSLSAANHPCQFRRATNNFPREPQQTRMSSPQRALRRHFNGIFFEGTTS